MFRLTGPGQVQIDVRRSGTGVLKALLYNFDFDDFADRKFRPLKPEHIKFLNDEVVPRDGHDWRSSVVSPWYIVESAAGKHTSSPPR